MQFAQFWGSSSGVRARASEIEGGFRSGALDFGVLVQAVQLIARSREALRGLAIFLG